MLAVMKIKEGGELAVGFQDHVPAFSPVAAIGSSPGDIFLTAKADATVSSVSGLDEDFGFIDKFDRSDSSVFLAPAKDRSIKKILKPEPLPPGRGIR